MMLRPLPAVLLVAGALVAGCAGGSGVPTDLASELAARAELAARQLDDGLPCEAGETVRGLDEQVAAAREDGGLTEQAASEVLATTARVLEDVRDRCDAAASPSPTETSTSAQEDTAEADAADRPDDGKDTPPGHVDNPGNGGANPGRGRGGDR